MCLTILMLLVIAAGVCLLLYAAVTLFQDRRFFTTAPKDIQVPQVPWKPLPMRKRRKGGFTFERNTTIGRGGAL